MSLTTGTRDLRMIEQVVTHPQWEMPPGLYKALPASMAEIVFKKNKKPDGSEEYAYSSRKRSIAARILTHMHQQNINAAPPAQDHNHNVQVSGDLHTTVEQMQEANFSDEELEKIASAAPLFDRLRSLQKNDEN